MRTTVTVPVEAEAFQDNTWNGRRFVKAHSVERGPLLANATTVAAARKELGAVVGQMLDEWKRPTILTHAGYVGVVYQVVSLDNVGWEYRLIRPDGSGGGTSCRGGTHDEAVRSLRVHIAQNATDWHDDASVFASLVILEPDQHHDHLRYAAWQRAARHAHILGEADVHTWASVHQNEFTVPKENAA